MKIAVISDIHSNLQALEAVLADIRGTGVDQVLCAGDIVGYGGNPNECCELVRGLTDQAVFGNHERAALWGETTFMNELAREAAEWTGRTLRDESREYLGTLRIAATQDISGRRVAMYHGSVGSETEYVYEEQVSPRLLEEARADILILGHTHVPYAVRFENGLVVNPGSVGQPRDGDPRASYAVIELVHLTCEQRRLDYDVDGARKSILDARLPSPLADRLLLGR